MIHGKTIDWIAQLGVSKPPVDNDSVVMVWFDSGESDVGNACDFDWSINADDHLIIKKYKELDMTQFYDNVEKRNEDLCDKIENKWIRWDNCCITGPPELKLDDLVETKFGDGSIFEDYVEEFDWAMREYHDERIIFYRKVEKQDVPIKVEFKKQEEVQGNPKYDKIMFDKYDHTVKIVGDVYTVIDAFGIECPALQHAAKKILNAGKRGHKDVMEDLIDIKHAVDRAIELEKTRNWNK